MIHLNLLLIQTALEIIDMKSTCSDVKAGADIISAQTAINTYNSLNQIQARDLDARLRREYCEIELLQVAIDNFPRIQAPITTQRISEPATVTRLRLDINGIVLSVLSSHGIIGQAKELIEIVSNE